jgi:hypothetical protein
MHAEMKAFMFLLVTMAWKPDGLPHDFRLGWTIEEVTVTTRGCCEVGEFT